MIFFKNFRENIYIYINYLFIIFALFIPLNRGISNTILYLSFILFLFIPNLKDKLKIIIKNKIFQIFILFILYNFLVLLWTPDKYYGIKYISQYFRYFLIFIFAFSLKEKYIKYVISAFLLGLFISEITAYGIYFNLWDTNFHQYHVGNKHDLSPFMNHIMYTLFLGIGLLIILIKIFFEKLSIKEKIFLFLFFLTMSGNMFMSGGRGGQVAFFLSFLTLIIYNIIQTKSYKYIFILLIPIILFILGYEFSSLFHQRVNQTILSLNKLQNFQFCTSFGKRIGAWIVSYEILKNPIHLFFGMGFKEPMVFLHNLIHTPEFHYLKCMDHNFSNFHLHNVYLMQITQTGLIGLLLYLSFLYKLSVINIKDNLLTNIKVIFLSMFIIASFVEPIFHHTWTANLFLLFSSIFIHFDIKKSLSP